MRRAVLGLAVLALAGCGQGDEDRIREIVDEVGENAAKGCEHASDRLLEGLGGRKACKRSARSGVDASDPDVKVIAVKVDGETARARIRGRAGDQTVVFVREDDDWKIDALR